MASRTGAGRCPALIWARSSDWICASVIVDPLLPAAGTIWNNPPNVPFPKIWFVPPEMFVLYCCIRLISPVLVISAKKLPMVGEVDPATCELYEPLPYNTCTT